MSHLNGASMTGMAGRRSSSPERFWSGGTAPVRPISPTFGSGGTPSDRSLESSTSSCCPPASVVGGRPAAAFRDRLIDAWHASPTLELADEEGPERWREWLLNHTPLDPELFSYQRAMNADESDAEELFSSIRSGDDFVRMLLRAVADPAEMHSFGDTLGAFAAQLARREGLERERAFAVDAVAALRPLAEANTALTQANADSAAARRDRWSLQAKLAAEVTRASRRSGAAAAGRRRRRGGRQAPRRTGRPARRPRPRAASPRDRVHGRRR